MHGLLISAILLAPFLASADSQLVDAMADKSQWVLVGTHHLHSLGETKLEISDEPARAGAGKVLRLTSDLAERAWMGIQWRGEPLLGRPRRLSFWFHGDGSGHRLIARFEDAAGQTFQVPLTSINFEGWREIEVPVVPTAWSQILREDDVATPVRWPVSLRELRVQKAGTKNVMPVVAFSELRVESQPTVIDRVKIRLKCDAPASVFYDNEPVQLQAEIENPSPEPVAGRLEAVACDWLGREERHSLAAVTIAPGQTHTAACRIPLKRIGAYTLWVQLVSDRGMREARQRVAVGRRHDATPVDDESPMGMGLYLHRIRDKAVADVALKLAREAGVKWTRMDMRISEVEPQKGRWIWDPLPWQPSPEGHAIEFSPHLRLHVSDSESINRPCGTGELTISARLRFDTLEYSSPWPSLFSKSMGEARQWSLFWNTRTGQLGVSLGDGKNRWCDCLCDKRDWEPGKWYDIVFAHRRDDRSARWWIDGRPSGERKTTCPTTLVAVNAPMMLGSGGLQGGLDDLAIYDRALEPASLAGTKPVAHWSFDEGRGRKIADQTGNGNDIQAERWRQDELLEAAREQGISTYHIICGVPQWMSSRMLEGGSRKWASFPRLDEWSEAVERAVAWKRKAGARVWEVWNEPNIPSFWAPEPDPDEYAQLLIATSKAVKKADPDAFVLGCSLAGPTATGREKQLEFVEAILKKGAGEAMDGISIHPYRQPRAPEETDYCGAIQAVSDLTAKYGRRLPIWITEVGWPTDPAGSSLVRSARMLVRSYLLAVSKGVQNIAWYDYRDDGVDQSYAEHHFGILYNDLTPKPSYFAYRTMATELAGMHFERDVPAGEGATALVFADGKRRTAVAWSHRGARQLAFQLGGRSSLETLDLMGNVVPAEVRDGIWLAKVDESAVFLRDVPGTLSVIRPIESSPALLKVLRGERGEFETTLRNPFPVPLHLKRGEESIELSPGNERRISCTIAPGGQPAPWRAENGAVLDVPTRVITLDGQREPILRHDPETSMAMELHDSARANAIEEVTVACRLRSEGPTGTWQSMATKWSAEDRNWGLILGRDTGELTFSATFTKGVRGFQDISSKHPLFDGQWHHVAATYSAHDAQVCFYVDGRLVQTVQRDGGPMPAITAPARVAGGFVDGRQKPAKTMAAMKGLRVWNRALSADEIAAQSR